MSGTDVRSTMPPMEKRECCSTNIGGAMDITSLGELEAVASKCRVVFVNFYSPLCTYCYMFHPIYAKIAEEMKGKAAFTRVNVAESLKLAGRFEVMVTPTTIVIIDGKPEYMMPGYMDYQEFHDIVAKLLMRTGCMSQA